MGHSRPRSANISPVMMAFLPPTSPQLHRNATICFGPFFKTVHVANDLWVLWRNVVNSFISSLSALSYSENKISFFCPFKLYQLFLGITIQVVPLLEVCSILRWSTYQLLSKLPPFLVLFSLGLGSDSTYNHHAQRRGSHCHGCVVHYGSSNTWCTLAVVDQTPTTYTLFASSRW